ncbi:hypothetical protein J5X84_21340 [Streptosporangiaceae bacterium NEAU-GS5]|nr:hypothetical protein [Streptosporangiaceae bacterium NEAU-GS5]
MSEISQPARKSGLVAGSLAGFVAAIVGAALYALFIKVTQWQMPLATIIIGLLVAGAIMAVRPTSRLLPISAALLAIVGGALGTIGGYVLVTVQAVQAIGRSVSYGEAFGLVNDHLDQVVTVRAMLYWAAGAVVAFGSVSWRIRGNRSQAAASAPLAEDPLPPGSLFQPAKNQNPTNL